MALVKKITKIGNSYGVILPSDVMSLVGLSPDDEVEITVEKGGVLLQHTRKQNHLIMDAFRQFVDEYDDTLKKLANKNKLTCTPDQLYQVMMKLANKELSKEDLARWLKKNCKSLPAHKAKE